MTESSNTSSDQSLSPQQARFIYWFNGLFPILTSIVTPLAVYRKVLKKPNARDIQRYNDLLQEVSRQLVSGTIGLVSYFSGGALTRGLLNLFPGKQNNQSNSGDQHVKMIVGGSVLSFIGYSFVRPSVATDILYLLRKSEASEKKLPTKPLSPWQKKLVNWVDEKLIPNGTPKLKKTALLSFGMLGGYLTALAFGIYGVSRAFAKLTAKSDRSQSTPTESNLVPISPPDFTVIPNRYGATYSQPTFRGAYKSPL